MDDYDDEEAAKEWESDTIRHLIAAEVVEILIIFFLFIGTTLKF